MNIEKVTFQNKDSEILAGRLELPSDQDPHNYAIFAHCFTCTKNLMAVKNISRALTMAGFGVLRFDFTGLGESEGDFENTNFSGNVDDLVAATEYLSAHFKPPTLMIGHSLGGAAAIFAAAQVPSIKAVATINSPSHPSHVQHLLESNLAEIAANGKAKVNLSGRPFTIKKQFLEDLENKSLVTIVKNLGKALLILHSPQDKMVSIKNAEEIYQAAHHPKSFVSLDGVDHLLTHKEDSSYVGKVIAGWASRYVDIPKKKEIRSQYEVVAQLDTVEKFSTHLKLGTHHFMADEPDDVGGNNFGPTPYQFLSGGLAACTAMTISMYAKRKKWDLKNVEVVIEYGKQHSLDCLDCENDSAKIDTFTRHIKLDGDLDNKQTSRLMEIADKCPVHRTLQSSVQIISDLNF